MPKFEMPGDGTTSVDLRVVSELTAVTTLSGEHDVVTRYLLLAAPDRRRRPRFAAGAARLIAGARRSRRTHE
jgi:hypothetical protein